MLPDFFLQPTRLRGRHSAIFWGFLVACCRIFYSQLAYEAGTLPFSEDFWLHAAGFFFTANSPTRPALCHFLRILGASACGHRQRCLWPQADARKVRARCPQGGRKVRARWAHVRARWAQGARKVRPKCAQCARQVGAGCAQPRPHRGPTAVPPRYHRGPTEVLAMSHRGPTGAREGGGGGGGGGE